MGEGAKQSPLSLGIGDMIDKDKIASVVDAYLANSDKFLVDIKVSTTNRVSVSIDGDQGVTIADCAALSRHIESCLDRDREDFELLVSSVGVGTPLTMTRQFRNNINRLVSLMLTEDRTVRGKLVEVSDEGIKIEKEIMKKGKKQKNLVTDQNDILFVPFSDIHETKILPYY